MELQKTNCTLNIMSQKYATGENVVATIIPIYEDLSNKEFLKKYLGCFRNNNENFNALFWKFVPKIKFSQVKRTTV